MQAWAREIIRSRERRPWPTDLYPIQSFRSLLASTHLDEGSLAFHSTSSRDRGSGREADGVLTISDVSPAGFLSPLAVDGHEHSGLGTEVTPLFYVSNVARIMFTVN